MSRVDIHSPIYVCLLGFGASVTGAPAREGMLLCLESVWRTACVRWSCARVWRPTYTRWLCVWRPTYTRWLCVWRICSMCIVSALGGSVPCGFTNHTPSTRVVTGSRSMESRPSLKLFNAHFLSDLIGRKSRGMV